MVYFSFIINMRLDEVLKGVDIMFGTLENSKNEEILKKGKKHYSVEP